MGDKVAITAFGTDEESLYAPHFAVGSYFLLYDPVTGNLEAVENTARNLPAGRGVAAAQLLIERGVGAVVTQFVGPKPQRLCGRSGYKNVISPGARFPASSRNFRLTRTATRRRASGRSSPLRKLTLNALWNGGRPTNSGRGRR